MGSHGLFRDLPARYGKDWAHCNISTCNHWVFSHIFLLSLPKLGNVEHEQRKKLSNLPMTKLGTNGADSGRLKIRSPEKKSEIQWLRKSSYGYGSIPIDTIFNGMNIHLPAILGFTRYQGFDPSPYLLGFTEKDPQGPRLSFSTGLFHRTSTVQPVCTPASCLSDSEPIATNVPGMSCQKSSERIEFSMERKMVENTFWNEGENHG